MTKFLTPADVSNLLRIPKRTIYKFANEGQIPGAFRIGRHWRFREDVIESWIIEQAAPKHLNRGK